MGRTGEPVPTPRFWRVWWRGLAAVVVLIVVAIVGGRLSGTDEDEEAEGVYAQVRLVLADQLRPRDCVLAGSLFDLGPRERAAAEKVSVTSCWGPHDGVVFGRMPLAGTAAETPGAGSRARRRSGRPPGWAAPSGSPRSRGTRTATTSRSRPCTPSPGPSGRRGAGRWSAGPRPRDSSRRGRTG
ncbi:hypothetical protein OIM90_24055 [Streptomyces sp. AD16]|nr:hypothetical protein OIM90_24055 [Streptomyces sp. AD16]